MADIETTRSLTGEGSKNRWYPNSITVLNHVFDSLTLSEQPPQHVNRIISNICYNTQYIEYLEQTLIELSLSSVIRTITIKNIVITSVSIIEAIFYVLCKNHGLIKPSKFKQISKTSNSTTIDDTDFRIDTSIFKAVETTNDGEIRFIDLSRKLEKQKILNLPRQFYIDLNHIRTLRNNVHLYVVTNTLKTDFDTYWLNELNLTKQVLYALLTNEVFRWGPRRIKENNLEQIFNFLSPNGRG